MPLLGSFSNTGKAKATRPDAPSTPSITSQASGEVGISWSAPAFGGGAPITDYQIEYTTNGGSSWTTWGTVGSAATSKTVTGLADYLTYNFRVSAINAVGIGAASSNSANAEQFNSATGGTVSTVSNYNGTGQTWKIHTFTSSGTLSVSASNYPFRTLAVAGGGAGGYDRGGGGGGGGLIYDDSDTLSNTSYSFTVGSAGVNTVAFGTTLVRGGNGGSYSSGSGGSGGSGGGGGGPSGAGGAGTAGQGTNGSSGDGWGGGYGGGLQYTSNINGSSVVYARRGPAGDWASANATPTDPGAGGYGGRNNADALGRTIGAPGIVIVAYRIA